jgi:hypothetical protein
MVTMEILKKVVWSYFICGFVLLTASDIPVITKKDLLKDLQSKIGKVEVQNKSLPELGQLDHVLRNVENQSIKLYDLNDQNREMAIYGPSEHVYTGSGTIKGKSYVVSVANSKSFLKSTYSKAIYLFDDRKDYYHFMVLEKHRKLANSVALISDANDISKTKDGYRLKTSKLTGQIGEDTCSQLCTPDHVGDQNPVKFYDQPVGGNCTGFLVKENVLVTAGHCILNEQHLKKRAFIFGFKMQKNGKAQKIFQQDQVYYGEKIISREFDEKKGKDYAVIKLKRSVALPDVKPLQLSTDINIDENVGLIGHPDGLPIKIAYGVNTSITKIVNENNFLATVDAFSGNSGSPVFNKDGLVVGILVGGQADWVFDHKSKCCKLNVIQYRTNEPLGESVSSSTQFIRYIP